MQRKIFRVKYFFIPCGLKILFFAPSGLFRIADSISFMAKDGDDTSDQKFMKIHVSTLKKLTCVLCPIRCEILIDI
jgi:hypothetical protein